VAVLLTFAMEYTLGIVFKHQMGGSGGTPSSLTTFMQVCWAATKRRSQQLTLVMRNAAVSQVFVPVWHGACLQGDVCPIDPEAAEGADGINEKALALKRLAATVASYSLVRAAFPLWLTPA
jgi:hypothetical protein